LSGRDFYEIHWKSKKSGRQKYNSGATDRIPNHKRISRATPGGMAMI